MSIKSNDTPDHSAYQPPDELVAPHAENCLTVRDVAELFGVTAQLVRTWVRDKRLNAVHTTHGWRISKSAVELFVRNQRPVPKRTVLLYTEFQESEAAFASALGRDGIELIVVGSLTGALVKLRSVRPVLVVLDCDCTEKTWDFIRRAKSIPRTLVRVLLVTECALSAREIEKAIELNVAGCLKRTQLQSHRLCVEVSQIIARETSCSDAGSGSF